MTATITETDVHDFIESADKETLDRVIASIKRRNVDLLNMNATQNAATITVGTKVTLQNLSIKALNGLTGTVTAVTGKGASVTLDAHSTALLAYGRTRFAADATRAENAGEGYVLR